MKKLLLIAAIIAAILIPSLLWAADGTATQSAVRDASGSTVMIKLVCTGSTVDGSLPAAQGIISTANMALIIDKYFLYDVVAYPTSGGTAPDAADVTVSMNGQDLLGAKGVGLIHATATYDTFPYSVFMSSYRFPAITNTLTVGVANEATISCNYTIELIFSR